MPLAAVSEGATPQRAWNGRAEAEGPKRMRKRLRPERGA